jgi:riboflavin synthase
MFTGLIEEIGIIHSIRNNEISITSKKVVSDSKIGDSISVNGLCLTITKINKDAMFFHTSNTTKEHSRFNAGDIRQGEEVNLEKALSLGGRLGGHLVLGHVDDKAKIIGITKKGEDSFFEFYYPEELKHFIAPKGSIAIDGISLTVSDVKSRSFEVTVIPHTLMSTNLKNKKINDYVHVEVDFFSRYIFNIIKTGGFRWN